MEEHECPLRNKIIKDADCFETVMAISRLYTKKFREELYAKYPNCEEICNNCKYNLEK